MESITQDDVIEILRMIEESSFDELHLEMGGLKLIVNKGGKKDRPAPKLETTLKESIQSTTLEEPFIPVRDQEFEAKPPAVLDAEGLFAIKAPMLGTFYKAPKPGAPPFVEEGKVVTEEDTVCIIEVMKLFNTVKAGVKGRIKKVCVEDAQMVEFGQTLFLVDEGFDEESS